MAIDDYHAKTQQLMKLMSKTILSNGMDALTYYNSVAGAGFPPISEPKEGTTMDYKFQLASGNVTPPERTRKDRLFMTMDTMVSNLYYYDRKEDDDLPVGSIEEMIELGEVTVDEMVEQFRKLIS